MQHAFLRVHRVIETGVGPSASAQIIGHRVDPREGHAVLHRHRHTRQGRPLARLGLDMGSGEDRELLATRQLELEGRYRHPWQCEPRHRRSVAFLDRCLERHLHDVHALAAQHGGKTTVLLDDGGTFSIDPEITEGHRDRHQGQGDRLADEDLDVVARLPQQGVVAQLAAIACPAHRERAIAQGSPAHHDRGGRRHAGGEPGRSIVLLHAHGGGGHHRKVDIGARILDHQLGSSGPRHRQRQHETAAAASRIDAVGELQGDHSGLGAAEGEPLRGRHQLHRSAIGAGASERGPHRQNRHRRPYILEDLDA